VAPFIGHVVVTVALLISAQPWAKRTPLSCEATFGIGIVAVLALLGLAFLWPGAAVEVTKYLPLRFVVAVAWLVAALLIVARGIVLGVRPQLRLGLGMVVVALSHGYWLYYLAVRPADPPDLAVHAVRLFGVLIVLLGAAELVWRTLRVLGEQRQSERSRLREAEAGLARLTERNHELRNGIAGLAGATTALDHADDQRKRDVMRCAVAAELSRLDALLREAPNPSGDCDLADALDGIARLWRANGLDVTWEIPPGLTVQVPSGVITQVAVNLLSNCARHAPGAPVRVSAERAGDRVRLTIADSGPGIAEATDIFAPGGKGPDSAGQGLGLSISRRLLAEHGAGIAVGRAGPGCAMVVDLPEAVSPIGWAGDVVPARRMPGEAPGPTPRALIR
jgi:two-component system OmpR family sensor kinase